MDSTREKKFAEEHEYLDEAGNWQCHHVPKDGKPAESTILNISDCQIEEWRRSRVLHQACPDCGVDLRVFEKYRIAKPYVDGTAAKKWLDPETLVMSAINRDIDKVIMFLMEKIPDLEIVQHRYPLYHDHDRLWFLDKDTHDTDILETGGDDCPFYVEENGKIKTMFTVDEVVNYFVKHFQ